MPERNNQTEQLFEFCYSLYVDPIYRHICFPQDVGTKTPLTREEFAQLWEERSGVDDATAGVEEALSRVIHTVGKLTPVERRVLILRQGVDLPYAQIAERVARSEDACHVIHYRALSEFCDRLNNQEYVREYAHA
jgi:DNA-directed RNA polymerase specialized sigma24 family protein